MTVPRPRELSGCISRIYRLDALQPQVPGLLPPARSPRRPFYRLVQDQRRILSRSFKDLYDVPSQIMVSDKLWAEDLTGLPGYLAGNLRGIQGTGNEMLAVARALKHGFIVFFKAWPDTNYDLVIDYKGHLFRVEVKGSQGPALNLTRGQRRGKQIDPKAKSRERKVSRVDCDIVIGVDAKDGGCYIIPIDYAQHYLGKNPTFRALSNFRDRWDFIHGNSLLDAAACRNGLLDLPSAQLRALCAKIRRKRSFPAYSKHRLVRFIYEHVVRK